MKGQGTSHPGKRYDAEFKRESVRPADTSGKTDRQIERDLGLYQGAIRCCRDELEADPIDAFPGHRSPEALGGGEPLFTGESFDMRRQGLRSKVRRKFVVTTDTKHDLKACPNLLNRAFDVDRPNEVWVSDISKTPKADSGS